MILGHYAVAFAAKKASPKTSLGIFFFASMLADLICMVFLLAGVEQVKYDPGHTRVIPLNFVHYSFSHSLMSVLMTALAFAFFYKIWKNDNRGAFWFAAVASSHWVLDVIVHAPDVPIVPGVHAYLGLGLWNFPAASLAFEIFSFLGSVFLYVRQTSAKNKMGSVGLFALAAVMVLSHLAIVSFLGEPTNFLILFAIAMILSTTAWAGWVDHHRAVKT